MARGEQQVNVDDPQLGGEARRALGDDLREAVGPERAARARDMPPAHVERPGGFFATIAANRLLIGIAFLVLVVTAAIVALSTGDWWLLPVVAGVHAVGTFAVTGFIVQMTTQVDRPSPETVARLEEEGVANPERAFNDLVEQLGGAEETRGTQQVLSPGHNERSAAATDDAARATVQQQTAMTPGSSAESSAGSRGAVALLPWGVVLAVMLLSVLFALVTGEGEMWLAPAILLPVGIGWIVMDRVMAARREDARTGATDRAAGAGTQVQKRSLLLPAGAVVAIVAFCVVMVAIVVA